MWKSKRLGKITACLAGAIVGLALSACSGPVPEKSSPGPTAAGDRIAVIEAHREFLRALRTGDVELLASLVDASTDLLIFHPKLESRIDEISKVRSGYQRMFRRLGAAEWTEVHTRVSVRSDVAWITYHFAVDSPKAAEPVLGRATEVWTRGGAGWKLIHAHWSEDSGRA